MIVPRLRVCAMLVASLALASCAAGSPPNASHDDRHLAASASPSPERSAPVAPIPDTLTASHPSGTLIGELTSQRGINQVGPLTVSSARVSVDVRCQGRGAVYVDVVGVASFTNDCSVDSSDLGTQNTVDVRHVSNVVVRVSGDDSLLWALALAESP